jgi:diguanylate cyclase (GGDEF)-like protein
MRATYIYTVMLTAKNRKQDLLLATEAGADDYLAKPVDPLELRTRIMAGKRFLQLQQSLRFVATHDFLTNLLNRSEIIAAVDRELSRSGREGKLATVIHRPLQEHQRFPQATRFLKEVARRLKSDLRPYDVVGRYGGEEFIIILPGGELATGARRADEIRNMVANGPFSTPFGTIPATVSVRVTVTSLGREHSVSDILHEACIRPKQKRRNRVELFSAAARQKGAGQS